MVTTAAGGSQCRLLTSELKQKCHSVEFFAKYMIEIKFLEKPGLNIEAKVATSSASL